MNAPTTLLVITPDQIYSEDKAEVTAMRVRIATYDSLLRDLMISIPDTSIDEDAMKAKIEEFGEAVLKLHNSFIAAAGTRAFWSGRFGADSPFMHWPLGTHFTMYGDGRFKAEKATDAERNKLREMVTTAFGQMATFDKPYEPPTKSEPEK